VVVVAEAVVARAVGAAAGLGFVFFENVFAES
jgi:hypothetical protein